MIDYTDHDLLVRVAAAVDRIDHTVNGNGQPGMVHRLTTLEARLEGIDLNEVAVLVKDIDKRAPSVKEKYAGWAAIASAVILALGTALEKFFG